MNAEPRDLAGPMAHVGARAATTYGEAPSNEEDRERDGDRNGGGTHEKRDEQRPRQPYSPPFGNHEDLTHHTYERHVQCQSGRG